MKKNKGFTLMEIMVSVAIMGVLLSIALPMYQDYVTQSNRVAMQTDLMRIASALERVRSVQLTYAGVNLSTGTIYGSTTYPIGTTGTQRLYTLTLGPLSPLTSVTVDGALTTDWEISAVPVNRQSKDGMMKLNSLGQSCWNKGINTSCNVADATQSWRNR